MGRTSGERLRVIARVAADAVTYAVTVAVGVTLAAVVGGVAVGGSLVHANYLLFLAGWVLMGYATIRLWPSTPEDLETGPHQRAGGESLPRSQDATRFQRFVRRLPPRRWVRTPRPQRRLTIPGKLFLAAVLVLATSLALEVVFGVG